MNGELIAVAVGLIIIVVSCAIGLVVTLEDNRTHEPTAWNEYTEGNNKIHR